MGGTERLAVSLSAVSAVLCERDLAPVMRTTECATSNGGRTASKVAIVRRAESGGAMAAAAAADRADGTADDDSSRAI